MLANLHRQSPAGRLMHSQVTPLGGCPHVAQVWQQRGLQGELFVADQVPCCSWRALLPPELAEEEADERSALARVWKASWPMQTAALR